METGKKRSDCPLGISLDVFGDKWSLLIIRDMMFGNKGTYNDFLKSGEGIATNILASRLKGLEENGIIEKAEHPDSKAKILYKLTPKGIDLLPVLMEIYMWSEKYYEIPTALKAVIKEAKRDKEAFIKEKSKEVKRR